MLETKYLIPKDVNPVVFLPVTAQESLSFADKFVLFDSSTGEVIERVRAELKTLYIIDMMVEPDADLLIWENEKLRYRTGQEVADLQAEKAESALRAETNKKFTYKGIVYRYIVDVPEEVTTPGNKHEKLMNTVALSDGAVPYPDVLGEDIEFYRTFWSHPPSMLWAMVEADSNKKKETDFFFTIEENPYYTE